MVYTFKDIKVWQKAHLYVLEVYRVTKNFPKFEMYGLTSQLRKSSSSIATNIVEGYKRRTDKDFAHFLNIAETSLEESKYQLLLACDLNYLDSNEFVSLLAIAEEVGRMLSGFQKKLIA